MENVSKRAQSGGWPHMDHLPNLLTLMPGLPKLIPAIPQCPRRSTFRYFSLPAEIRDEIMRLVLYQGDIHIRAVKTRGLRSVLESARRKIQQLRRECPQIPPAPQLPGFQFLATCKQAYAEGHQMFYMSNTFFLPPGPFIETLKHFFENLQPRHARMIRSAGITLGLQDLTSAIITKVRDVVGHRLGNIPPRLARTLSFHMEEIYADLLHATLCHIWTRKLAFLRRSTGFKTIKIVAGDREVVIDNRDARSMENGNGKDDFRRRRLRDMAQIVGHATVIVRRELEGRIRRGGWRELRDWVDGGGFRAGV